MSQTIPKGLVIDDEIITVGVSREVQDVVDAVINSHIDELDEALRPYGLSTYQLAAVHYRRIVTPDEVGN